MTARNIYSQFMPAEQVTIDGGDLVGVVVAVCWESDRITYRVEWLHQGAMQSAWLDAWRLKPVAR